MMNSTLTKTPFEPTKETTFLTPITRWLRVTRVDLFLIAYAALYAFVLTTWSFVAVAYGPAAASAIDRSFVMVAALVALGYGIFRGIYFSPFDHVGYGHWLRDSGWQHPQPLPLGPLRLVWQDALLLGVIALSLPLELVTRLAVPVVAFAISYCIPAWNWSLAQRVYLFGYGLPWLIGCGILAVWAESIVGLSLVAIVCLVLSQMATTRALAKFDEYESSQPLALVSASKTPEKDPSAGWPATVLLTPTTERRWSPGHAIAAGAVVAWLVITIAGPADMILRQHELYTDDPNNVFADSGLIKNLQDYMHFIGSLAILGVVIPCALMRVARYCGQLLPPISLWGRVRTGRFIIPGYDNVFIAPLAAVLIAIALPTSLVMVGVPLSLSMALATGLAVAAVLGLPPSLDEWAHTGHHRIVPALLRSLAKANQAQQATTS